MIVGSVKCFNVIHKPISASLFQHGLKCFCQCLKHISENGEQRAYYSSTCICSSEIPHLEHLQQLRHWIGFLKTKHHYGGRLHAFWKCWHKTGRCWANILGGWTLMIWFQFSPPCDKQEQYHWYFLFSV